MKRTCNLCSKAPCRATIPIDPNNTDGLPTYIKLTISSRVICRSDVKVNEGLINGNMSIEREFQWPALRNDQLEDGELLRRYCSI